MASTPPADTSTNAETAAPPPRVIARPARSAPPRPRPVSNRAPKPQRLPPDHVGLLLAAALMMIVGWGGLYWLITSQAVGLGPQIWAFFVLLDLAVTGTVLPIVRWINVLFTAPGDPFPPGGVIARQSAWIGLFVVICAWLQIPRALSMPLALGLALMFLVLEVFLRTREINRED
jgi:hypothetical protein